jgi:hypothetical protein
LEKVNVSRAEPDPDDADTGPLETSHPDDRVDPDDGWGRPAETWAGRFDAPLTVSPRQVQTNRRPVVFFSIVAVVVIAAVGGLIYWLVRPSGDASDAPSASPATSSASPSTESDPAAQTLTRMLPAGYPAGSCKPAAAPKGVAAQVTCDTNSDPGGPMTATYSLAKDKAALDSMFNDVIAASTRVNCPGNIQSPGPWRRNATPDKVSGTLFCGLQGNRPTIAWTDDSRLTVSAVQAGPSAPTFDELYAWWSSHS